MYSPRLLLLVVSSTFIVDAIELSRGKSFSFSSSSSSSSLDSSEYHRRHSYSGKGGRPSRPGSRPNRPSRSSTTTRAPNPSCPAGWTLFNRQMGAWCVQLFPGAYGQEQAENACRSYGAVLSSVENADERSRITNMGLTMMLPTGWKFGTIRTGLRRDSIGSSWYTTDQFTTGMQGLVWSPLEPNQGYWQGRPNNCGLIWLWVPGGKQEGARVLGTFFAMECLTSPPDRWRGFICGKRAT
ncbi:CRE-CLEC-157 protein [Caenorhabditis remanei]|uniref:CRE-CLEC-157 protein n=1 Tax=Caenorhabditis remanei TaxID=31234 RepID=E3MCQ2_CAERE|nr:CRE-CLEC-157 protein [Caenorhabditis remanei]